MAYKKKKKKKNINIALIFAICVVTTFFSVMLLTRNLFSKDIYAEPAPSSQTVSDTISSETPTVSIEETENILLNEFKINPIADNLSIKAMNIRIGQDKDFPSNSVKSQKALEQELKGILDYAKNLGMNSVVIDATPFANAIYPSNILPLSNSIYSKEGITAEYDLLKFTIDEAKSRNLKVIASINPLLVCPPKGDTTKYKAINEESTVKLDDGSIYYNPSLFEVRDLIENVAKEIASYDLYGIILEDINYPTKDFNDNLAYLKSDSNLSIEDFRRRNTDLILVKSISAIKTINQNILVGVSCYGIWDIYDNQTDGIDIKAQKSSYNDYYADSLNWINKGYIDFLCPKIEWSTENKTYSLKKISSWWAEKINDSGINLYFSHPAYKVGGKEIGFNSISELSKEYDYLRGIAQYGGSFFDSYKSLKENTNSTEALVLLFKGLLDFSTISNTLAITSPKSGTTTDIENISIRGACDNNFPLTMNGKTIKPTSKGIFAIDVTLKPGKNSFKFSHKGKTQTLTITYKIVVLKDISPSTDIVLNGDSLLNVSVTAHKDSVISGVFNGQTVTFVAVANESDKNHDEKSENAEFIKYSGSFTMPQAIDEVQNLGKATVTASFKGFTEVLKTANVSVNAKEIVPVGNYHIVEIVSPYAQCYDIDIKSHASSPNFFFLPKGTKDFIESEIYDTTSGKDTSLWVLKSGQKVKKADCKDYNISEILNNDITSIKTEQLKKSTIITFEGAKNAIYKASFNNSFPNLNKADFQPKFDTAFDATLLEITLYNTSNAPDIEIFSCPIINSVTKTKIDETTYKYTFTLKEKGKFFGFKVDYNENGDMYLKINNPIVLSSDVDKPLNGIKIMLDPGHGGIDGGANPYPSLKLPNECQLNLIISNYLKDYLNELGATVIMTRTDNETTVSLDDRVQKAWSEQPDIFISIHNNSYGSTARGVTTLYFYGFNSNLAKAIHNSVLSVHKYANGGNNYNSVTRYQTTHILRNSQTMSLLIECGFMSNAEEYQWLCEPETAPKIAKAITDGLMEYFKS